MWVSKQVGGLNRRSKNELVWPTFQRYMRVCDIAGVQKEWAEKLTLRMLFH